MAERGDESSTGPFGEREGEHFLGPGLFRRLGENDVRLIGGRCLECERSHFPQSEICPYCSAYACTSLELGPHGSLWLFTSVVRAPPGYLGRTPFGFGVVDLPEGVRLVTRLTEGDPGKLRRGMKMRLVIDAWSRSDEPDAERICAYAFAPCRGSRAGE